VDVRIADAAARVSEVAMKTAEAVAGGVLVFALVAALLVVSHAPPKPAAPAPTPFVEPEPEPEPEPVCPNCPRKPRRPKVEAVSSFVGGPSYQGDDISAAFPVSQYMTNIGSHVDGAGMCVSTSIEMLARYLGLDDLRGFRDWCARYPGGASADKIARQLPAFCKSKGIRCPAFLQYEGDAPEKLLSQLDAARVPFAHTYGYSPRYGHRISHMVFSAKFGDKYAVVIDNNEIGGVSAAKGTIYEWMSPAEHIRRMKYGGGGAWVFAFIAPPIPPCPKVGG
jgi:hypothetical protein